jgi:predicted methyltransferase
MPQETALVRRLLNPGMTFVDVGANRGYFTLLGASLVGPAGRVVSVEADPRGGARSLQV